MKRNAAVARWLLPGFLLLTLPVAFLFARALAGGRASFMPRPVSVQGNQPPVSPDRVLLVFNTRKPESRTLADYYAAKRRIPDANILRLSLPETDECTLADYRVSIENFVRDRARANPRIEYVVLGPGFPFRLADFGSGGGYSVDAVLATCLMTPRPTGKRANPYFNAKERFSRAKFGNLLLVTRLDGVTAQGARKMVDSALKAQPLSGPFYLRDSFVMGMKPANNILKQRGLETDWVEGYNNAAFPRYQGLHGPYMAHWGAGPHDTQFSQEEFAAMTFLPGALSDITWSVSAAGLRNRDSKGNIALLTGSGAAGAHGYVSEPFADAVSKPEIVLARYTRGFNLAESFYMGSPYIYWKVLVLGDPLCAPYAAIRRTPAVTAERVKKSR